MQPLEHILQVGPWVMPVGFVRLRQAHHHRRALARELAAREQLRLAAHRPRTHEALDVVVVHAHRTIVEEAAEPRPALEAVVDGTGDDHGVAAIHAELRL